MSLPRPRFAASLAALVLAAAPAWGSPPLQVATLAATCANCHGTQGRAVAGSPLPTLAGMPSDAMLAQLRAFRAGTRPSTIMAQLSKGYSEAQLEQVAEYFARQPR
ncbi:MULTISPECIES: c-type cytochrome [Ramlibacter]|uniref:C-type cytochrome n=1 Tax=Ramlibacter pinisoli TaxID=2682844 RepID=A0A6N8INV9_9BURK|nr:MULTISPECIES: c-type cytochrome [Ramlibacter]MBA2963584.1 c-type cytochrome [Ramlibacter sp. CGMCC 1.13660]MVQ28549.1 c-type cytochrome [Ramlibacter pinisoli]